MARCYQVHLRLMSQCAGLLEVRVATQMQSFTDTMTGPMTGPTPGDDEPDLMRPNDKWDFSMQQDYLHSTVHYLHRTTRDFLEKQGMQEIIDERLRGSKFDGAAWLAAHSLIALGEADWRMREAGLIAMDLYEGTEGGISPQGHSLASSYGGYGRERWGTVGFQDRGKRRNFEYWLSKCKDDNIRRTLLDGTELIWHGFREFGSGVKEALSLIDSI
ncbi:hypothetical protein B0T14DRAFT_567557 [Immersiella caudata]|uniref:DUF7791 domain-containing protein n=1 Tax=Immersiella caudata TaxID=314043 RepID=A0AA40C133_9PEZI|nr:hypothetical protein B0T14DRAFT_567557 [Immersiella caudata]